MNDFFYFIYLSFKNISPLRIFQIIESKKLILNGLCLELGASEQSDKNFSNYIKILFILKKRIFISFHVVYITVQKLNCKHKYTILVHSLN